MSTYRPNDTKTKLKMMTTHISSMKKKHQSVMQTILGISNGRSDRRNAVGFKRRVQTLSDAWRWRQQRRLSADEADCSRHQVQTPKTNADRIQRVHVANDIQTPPRIYDYVAELSCAKSKQNHFAEEIEEVWVFFSHTHNIQCIFIRQKASSNKWKKHQTHND